ncbi:MAG: hypothetical protein O3B73_18560, partial [bacterium]|nr:hypothetical protein [bacterium]
FERDARSDEIEARMQAGFQLRRSLGANEFPSLILKIEDSVHFLVRGFGRAEVILDRLGQLLG